MNLYVVRHGETDLNRKHIIQGRAINSPLNDLGRKQASEVAGVLKHKEIDLVVTSSLIRTHQTAEPLLEYVSYKESYAELDEISFGELEGMEFKNIKEKIQHIHNEWISGNVDYQVMGGESPRQVYDRASGKIMELLEQHKGKNIAFMLHGRLIRILLSEWLGMGLKNMHLVKHANGSINHLLWENPVFKEIELNKTDHLSDFVVL